MLIAIVGSIRPLTPGICCDSPAFVKSALHMLETWRPAIVDARDPGYPIVLAMIFTMGGSLRSVILLQYLTWAILVIALAATLQTVTRAAYSLGPILLLAMYPGLLIYRNLIQPEAIYTFFLNMAALGLLLSRSIRSPIIRCGIVSAAIIAAALAVCFKSQGILVLIAVVCLGAWIAWPYTFGRLAVLLVSCAGALALLATGSRVGASSADKFSVEYVEKMLFCNHLDIVLASEPAKREIASATGDSADAMLARLAADLGSKRLDWPTLGFYGDECLFDEVLDQYLTENDVSSPHQVAAFYRRIFLVTILDRPLLYVGKIVQQLYYGAWFSWPPHGLQPMPLGWSNDALQVIEMLKQRGLPVDGIEPSNGRIRGWILSDLGRADTLLFGGLSAAFVVAIPFWILVAVSGWRPAFSMRAGIVIALWVVSVLPTASAITFDDWRYLVPATPMVALFLSMVCVELPETFAAYRRTLCSARKKLS